MKWSEKQVKHGCSRAGFTVLLTWTPTNVSCIHPHERVRFGAVILRCCTSALEGSDRRLPCSPARYAASSSRPLLVSLASWKAPRCLAVKRNEMLHCLSTRSNRMHLLAERTAQRQGVMLPTSKVYEFNECLQMSLRLGSRLTQQSLRSNKNVLH